MAIVLCTGVESTLMQTRKLILEQAGHTVVTAQSNDKILAACREFRFDVAVIGQAAEAKRKREYAALVRKECPSVKVLELLLPNSSVAIEDADDWLASPAIPRELAARVDALATRTKTTHHD